MDKKKVPHSPIWRSIFRKESEDAGAGRLPSGQQVSKSTASSFHSPCPGLDSSAGGSTAPPSPASCQSPWLPDECYAMRSAAASEARSIGRPAPGSELR